MVGAVSQEADNSLLMDKLRALKMAAGANADVVNRREMEITAQITPVKPRRNADSTLVSEDSDVGRPPVGSLTDAIMVTELRREIVDLRADAAASAEEVQRVRRQVEVREAEIKRLSKLAEAGQDMERFNLESINATNQRIIETLNDQVDFLNEELAAKEAALAAKEDSTGQLEAANKRIGQLQVRSPRSRGVCLRLPCMGSLPRSCYRHGARCALPPPWCTPQDALSRCERRNAKLKLELDELTDMTKVCACAAALPLRLARAPAPASCAQCYVSGA